MIDSPIPREIFRAYDIRGRALGADAPLTPDLALRIAMAFAGLVDTAKRVVVGGDCRPTTPALQQAAIAGLLDAGLDVVDIGRAPSPLVYWATARLTQERPTAGVVVTASHNPAEDNGIKLLHTDAMPFSPEEIQAVADRVASGVSAGLRQGNRSLWSPRADYIRGLAQSFPLRRPLRIAIDPGNGVATVTAGPALRAIGCEVIAINDDPEEPDPPHPADPQHADNVAQLAQFVAESGADLGFAFDGDGDRLGLVNGRGRRATPDQVLALLAEDWLERRPGADIHVDVKTSQAVIDHIRNLGGRARFGPVGHSLGKYAMRKQGIDFGGEASTHYYYRIDDPPHITDDAVRTACRIAQFVSTNTLEERLDRIPRYRISPEVKIPCPDDRKHAVADRIVADARRAWPVNDIDGARIDLSRESAGAWCLIRASNTTPFLTVVVEARTDREYEQVRAVTADILNGQDLDPSPLLSQRPLD
ncbi:MAG: phosphomannomutase/phosphoglucomutase [Chloroflexi bacterium]|nr:phosphomannomutase/phosphoglucomutase [Chloroflexota bacterium]MCY3696397.1 phosphomannomutase/phosphoglucomutase [Chloroflexota bacterium]